MYHSILGDEIPAETEEDEAETEKTENPPKTDTPEARASKKKKWKIAGISAASLVLVACLAYAGIGIYNRQKTSGPAATISGSAENPAPLDESEEIDLNADKKVVACYYKDTINMFIAYYGEEALLSTYGMDVSKPLKEQENSFETGKTWFDTMMEQATSTLEQQLIVCAAAQDAGYTLTAEDKELIETAIAGSDIASYGNSVTEEDLRKALSIQRLSTSYYEYLLDQAEITDADLEAYYEENKYSYLTCGLGGFTVSYAADENGNAAMTQETAAELKDQLMACKNTDEFEALVKDILTEYEGYSEEELEEALPTMYNTAYTYTQNNPVGEWAFGDAAVNETYCVEGDESYSIYIMVSEPARDDSPTVNVRHILFMNEADNMAAAQQALEDWKSGDQTEDSFAILAEELSEDPGSNTNGGLYENVYQGQMVDTFNDWCFDTSRQPGDTGIVETSYGVHVMYFSGYSDPAWKIDAYQALQNQYYSSWLTQQKSIYTVTLNDSVINSIEG